MSLIINEGDQYSFGTKCHTRNGYAPMYVSLMASKNYNTSGQHLQFKGAGSPPNDYKLGYSMSMFLVDNKDDRGFAYLTEVSSTGWCDFWWEPIILSSGSLSWGTEKHMYIQLHYGRVPNVWYPRIVAIKRDSTDKSVFTIYYYLNYPYSPYDDLWKCELDYDTSTYTNTKIISSFVKPAWDYPYTNAAPWAAEREVLNDDSWYFWKYDASSGHTHVKVYSVDLVGETQTTIWDFTLPDDRITPGDMFLWGATVACRGKPLISSTGGGGWDINLSYIDSTGDVHIVGRNISDTQVTTNPFGTLTGVGIYMQGYNSQPSADTFHRWSWTVWYKVVAGVDTFYLSTTIFYPGGYSHTLDGPLYTFPDGSPYYWYGYAAQGELMPLTWGEHDYVAEFVDTGWYWVEVDDNAVDSAVSLPTGYTLVQQCYVSDTIHGYQYIECTRDSDSAKVILVLDSSNTLIREIVYDYYSNSSYTSVRLKIFGNFLIWIESESTDYYGHDFSYAHTADIGAGSFVIDYLNNDTDVDVGPGGNFILMMLEQN